MQRSLNKTLNIQIGVVILCVNIVISIIFLPFQCDLPKKNSIIISPYRQNISLMPSPSNFGSLISMPPKT